MAPSVSGSLPHGPRVDLATAERSANSKLLTCHRVAAAIDSVVDTLSGAGSGLQRALSEALQGPDGLELALQGEDPLIQRAARSAFNACEEIGAGLTGLAASLSGELQQPLQDLERSVRADRAQRMEELEVLKRKHQACAGALTDSLRRKERLSVNLRAALDEHDKGPQKRFSWMGKANQAKEVEARLQQAMLLQTNAVAEFGACVEEATDLSNSAQEGTDALADALSRVDTALKQTLQKSLQQCSVAWTALAQSLLATAQQLSNDAELVHAREDCFSNEACRSRTCKSWANNFQLHLASTDELEGDGAKPATDKVLMQAIQGTPSPVRKTSDLEQAMQATPSPAHRLLAAAAAGPALQVLGADEGPEDEGPEEDPNREGSVDDVGITLVSDASRVMAQEGTGEDLRLGIGIGAGVGVAVGVGVGNGAERGANEEVAAHAVEAVQDVQDVREVQDVQDVQDMEDRGNQEEAHSEQEEHMGTVLAAEGALPAAYSAPLAKEECEQEGQQQREQERQEQGQEERQEERQELQGSRELLEEEQQGLVEGQQPVESQHPVVEPEQLEAETLEVSGGLAQVSTTLETAEVESPAEMLNIVAEPDSLRAEAAPEIPQSTTEVREAAEAVGAEAFRDEADCSLEASAADLTQESGRIGEAFVEPAKIPQPAATEPADQMLPLSASTAMEMEAEADFALAEADADLNDETSSDETTSEVNEPPRLAAAEPMEAPAAEALDVDSHVQERSGSADIWEAPAPGSALQEMIVTEVPTASLPVAEDCAEPPLPKAVVPAREETAVSAEEEAKAAEGEAVATVTAQLRQAYEESRARPETPRKAKDSRLVIQVESPEPWRPHAQSLPVSQPQSQLQTPSQQGSIFTPSQAGTGSPQKRRGPERFKLDGSGRKASRSPNPADDLQEVVNTASVEMVESEESESDDGGVQHDEVWDMDWTLPRTASGNLLGNSDAESSQGVCSPDTQEAKRAAAEEGRTGSQASTPVRLARASLRSTPKSSPEVGSAGKKGTKEEFQALRDKLEEKRKSREYDLHTPPAKSRMPGVLPDVAEKLEARRRLVDALDEVPSSATL